MIWSLLLIAGVADASPAMPDFLAGCWEERRGDGGWTEECWTTARGGLMLGSARTGQGHSVSHWEWMRIETNAQGIPTFYGAPKGAPPVAFAATQGNAGSITFVNATHDYPQRIRYARTSTGVEAEISLADGTKPARWDFRRSTTSMDE